MCAQFSSGKMSFVRNKNVRCGELQFYNFSVGSIIIIISFLSFPEFYSQAPVGGITGNVQ
jgi:hypothetical protein